MPSDRASRLPSCVSETGAEVRWDLGWPQQEAETSGPQKISAGPHQNLLHAQLREHGWMIGRWMGE